MIEVQVAIRGKEFRVAIEKRAEIERLVRAAVRGAFELEVRGISGFDPAPEDTATLIAHQHPWRITPIP
jgi:hypothetical protein